MTLHWLIAAALALQIGLAEGAEHLPRGKGLFDTMQFHKAVGITILLLSLVRLAVRFAKPRPAPLADQGWATRLASITHWGLYAFMVLGPLTGWLAASTGRIAPPIDMFGMFTWPHFPAVSGLEEATRHSLHEFGEVAHGAIAKIGLLLFLLHIVGALRHQGYLKQAIVERMLPGSKHFSPLAGSALIVALMLGFFGLLNWAKMPGIAPASDQAAFEAIMRANRSPPMASQPASSGDEGKNPDDK